MSNAFTPFFSDDETAHRLIASITITDLVTDEEVEQALRGTPTLAENAAAFVQEFADIDSEGYSDATYSREEEMDRRLYGG